RFLETSAALPKPPKSPPPPPPPPLVECLVKSLDLPVESAVSVSQKVGAHRDGIKKADAVLRFLRSHGFGKAQMAKLVTNGPALLLSNVESNLKPKLEYFREIGLSESVLLGTIAGNSRFFGRSLDSYYKPQIDFLKKYLRTSSALDIAIKRCSWLLTVDRRTLVMKVEKMAAFVESVKGLGMEPSSPKFIHGLRAMSSMTESTWNKKVENFKSLGWSQEDFLSMFVRHPHCLALSEKKIKRTLDFYLNTASIALEIIVRQPLLLQFSVDKRLRPRHNVITFLSSMGLLKGDKPVVTPFKLTEELFMKRYVMKHAEHAEQ
ncbi:hypothetical protein EUGRSUZ_G03190, partial [Eucalyptus grandis]